MRIITQPLLDFQNVLIRPKRSIINSRSKVSLERTFTFPYAHGSWTGVPIIAANMDTTGTFDMHKALTKHKMLTALHKFYTVDDYKIHLDKNDIDNEYCMISTGISDKDYNRLKEIMCVVDARWICIDIANGYIRDLVDFCSKVRGDYPDKIIVAGNVATRELVEELILEGKVDIVKVGIGPGSACLTRMKTGVGVPQLSAIIECSDAAHGIKGHIIGDGGITCPGDMGKAFGGGADFVMCGGLFSGHDESGGQLVEEGGVLYKEFYGMSSDLAMKKHFGKMNEYRSSEGRTLRVKYKGRVNHTINDYLGGLRSTCTYINAKNIKDIPKCTTFQIVSQQLNTSLIK
jgi:GMP reductase